MLLPGDVLKRRRIHFYRPGKEKIDNPPQFWYTTTCARRCVRVA